MPKASLALFVLLLHLLLLLPLIPYEWPDGSEVKFLKRGSRI
jgi:hypothetical protein